MAKKGIDTVFVHYGIRREVMAVTINARYKTGFYNRPRCCAEFTIIHHNENETESFIPFGAKTLRRGKSNRPGFWFEGGGV